MQSLSLNFRITAFALFVAAIPLSMFQLFSVERSATSLLEFLRNDLESQALVLSRQINRYIQQRVDEAKLITKSNVFTSQPRDVMRAYLDKVVADVDAITRIDVIDRTGIVQVSSSRQQQEGNLAWDIHLGVKDVFQQMLKAESESIFITEAKLLETGPQIIYLSTLSNRTNNRVYALLIEIRIIDLENIVNDFGERTLEGNEIYVVDKYGSVIISTNTEVTPFHSFPDFKVQEAAIMLGDIAVGSVTYKDMKGREVMAGFADMNEFGENKALDWNIITLTPMEDFTRPVRETRTLHLLVGGAFLLLALAIAYWFARSITVPLRSTVRLAEELRKGNYSQRLQTNHLGGEIGSLARAINEMADRVEERTAEIISRNENLTSEIVERKLAEDRLKQLSHKIVHLQEEERRRVSRELHDGINQLLVSVKYKIENFDEAFKTNPDKSLGELNKAVIFLDEAISEVRRVSHALRPTVLDDLGLGPALANLVNQFSDRNQIDILFSGYEADAFRRLPSDVETALYRIVQEALMNIEKHANATNVAISVTHTDTNVTIRIEDNGDGFDVQAALRKSESSQGLGLRNMRERIELLQGNFFIHSDVGKGTFIELKAPLAKQRLVMEP